MSSLDRPRKSNRKESPEDPKSGIYRREFLKGAALFGSAAVAGAFLGREKRQEELEAAAGGAVIGASERTVGVPWEQSDKPLRERINFPHAEAATKLVGEYSQKEGAPANLDVVKDLFYTYLEENINNIQIFQSKKFEGVSFPVSLVNTSEFAKVLYAKYKGHDFQSRENTDATPPKKTKEFIFGSFVNTTGGSVFTFFEEAFHQAIMKLPAALEALEKGEEPESTDAYVVGSPTNLLGTLTPEFSNSLTSKNTYDRFGELYAELVESELDKDKAEDKEGSLHTNPNLYLYGISMGASFATKTAERVLADKRATQSFADSSDENQLPHLQVRADVPVGSIESRARLLEIPIGFFAIEGVYKLATDSYTRAAGPGEGKFVQETNAVLAERGIQEHMSKDQEKLKKKTLSNFAFGLIHGTPIAPELKVDIVRATHDPLVYSRSFRKEAEEQKEAHKGSLGENLVPSKENRRTTAIDQSHSIVFFRPNEERRILKAAGALEQLRSKI